MLALVILPARGQASDWITYHVSLAEPQQHLFRIRLSTNVCRNGHLLLQLPAWNALYQIRDFVEYLREFRAQDASGQSLEAEKLDKQTWQIACRDGSSVDVSYQIFWNENSPYSSQLDSHHAFINLADILMYLPQARELPVSVEFADVPPGWRVSSPPAQTTTPTQVRAGSYDGLVDTPVEVGTFDDWDIVMDGATYRVIVDADRRSYSREKMTRALEAIVRTETGLFGEQPFKLYTFFFHFLPGFISSFPLFGSTGGMEHMWSTAIHLSERTMREDPLAFSQPAAHEFFHVWNVKRIRPQQLEPVDYTRENYTRALWFAEGGTTGYEMYVLLRSGLWDRGQFYWSLAQKIAELEQRPARRWKSVEEASLDAWLEKYAFYQRPEQSFSYYTKGAILTILLDLAIRNATDNYRSMDDVLRYLNGHFAHEHRFYDDHRDIPAAVAAVVGHDLDDFFRRYVSGTDEIPYDDFFRTVGLRLRREEQMRPSLGLSVYRGPSGRIVVTEVEPDSVADRAAVVEGDVVVSLEGESVGRDFDRRVRRLSIGRTVRLRIRRGEEERELKLVVGSRPEVQVRLEEVRDADERAVRLREAWLSGRTD